jgi:hypothetical protein
MNGRVKSEKSVDKFSFLTNWGKQDDSLKRDICVNYIMNLVGLLLNAVTIRIIPLLELTGDDHFVIVAGFERLPI